MISAEAAVPLAKREFDSQRVHLWGMAKRKFLPVVQVLRHTDGLPLVVAHAPDHVATVDGAQEPEPETTTSPPCDPTPGTVISLEGRATSMQGWQRTPCGR